MTERFVFVHFFGGNQDSMSRHVKMVNQLGFDAVSFDLDFDVIDIFAFPPVSSQGHWGLKSVGPIAWKTSSIRLKAIRFYTDFPDHRGRLSKPHYEEMRSIFLVWSVREAPLVICGAAIMPMK